MDKAQAVAAIRHSLDEARMTMIRAGCGCQTMEPVDAALAEVGDLMCRTLDKAEMLTGAQQKAETAVPPKEEPPPSDPPPQPEPEKGKEKKPKKK